MLKTSSLPRQARDKHRKTLGDKDVSFLQAVVAEQLAPPPSQLTADSPDAEIDAYIAACCETGHHVSGTACMGPADDPRSVCDEVRAIRYSYPACLLLYPVYRGLTRDATVNVVLCRAVPCRVVLCRVVSCTQEGRVHGIDGLRVVDASLMPDCVRSNTNATVLMMAERLSATIREQIEK
jgi:choline dehydrogenase-like flavoprotein